jgi:hypothetical protein
MRLRNDSRPPYNLFLEMNRHEMDDIYKALNRAVNKMDATCSYERDVITKLIEILGRNRNE